MDYDAITDFDVFNRGAATPISSNFVEETKFTLTVASVFAMFPSDRAPCMPVRLSRVWSKWQRCEQPGRQICSRSSRSSANPDLHTVIRVEGPESSFPSGFFLLRHDPRCVIQRRRK